MPEPKRLRLLRVTKSGYLVGSGEIRKNTHVLIPHEALIAILTGLHEDKDRQAEGLASDHDAVTNSANYFRQQAEGIAWRLGVCSFDKDHRAVPFNPATPPTVAE
jgi:hypothetical protein